MDENELRVVVCRCSIIKIHMQKPSGGSRDAGASPPPRVLGVENLDDAASAIDDYTESPKLMSI